MGVTVSETGAPGYRFEVLHLSSTDGARRYRIRVAVPTAIAARPRSLIWVLDGNAALMSVDAAFLTRLSGSQQAPVIAFVSHDNDLRIDAEARAYDYTPRRPGGDAQQRDVIAGRMNGGADAFLQMLKEMALPRITQLTSVDANRQALWGHSYGGVFVLHALFTAPQSFRHYAAADPSLWWGKAHLLTAAPTGDMPQWRGRTLMVWQAGGSDAPRTGPARDPALITAMRNARAAAPADAAPRLVAKLNGQGLHAEFVPLPGLGHGDTLAVTLRRFLLAMATIPEAAQ